MRFVSDHLTIHHLLHKPHRWFLAVLLSPFHAAQVHYKNRYHLTYRHAKKLFAFDLGLLISIVVLSVASIYWLTYDPTVTQLVRVNIEGPTQRVQSGEYVTYTVIYQNNSDIVLTEPRLALRTPNGFILNETSPSDVFDVNTHVFSLTNLAPDAEGQVVFSGWFFDVPERQNSIAASLSYSQKENKDIEIRTARILTTLRGSTLSLSLRIPDTIIASGETPFEIDIQNNSDTPLNDIYVPLFIDEYLQLEHASASLGDIRNETLHIDTLKPKQVSTLKATLKSSLPSETREARISITPSILVKNEQITQAPATKDIHVVSPRVNAEAYWVDAPPYVKPKTTASLHIVLSNTGTVPLLQANVRVRIPQNVVNIPLMRTNFSARYSADSLTILPIHHAALLEIKPGDTIDMIIPLPLYTDIAGTDVSLSPEVLFESAVDSIDNGRYTEHMTPPPIKVGTNLSATAETRYFTAEGDQLGRGPLPPAVLQETKYWAIVGIQNTTSRVENLTFTATLAPHVTWSDRTSVSRGANVRYVDASRGVSWTIPNIDPAERIGIYMELGLIPTTLDIGSTPLLLQDIKITGTDSFTGEHIVFDHPDITTALPTDALGRARGERVR